MGYILINEVKQNLNHFIVTDGHTDGPHLYSPPPTKLGGGQKPTVSRDVAVATLLVLYSSKML